MSTSHISLLEQGLSDSEKLFFTSLKSIFKQNEERMEMPYAYYYLLLNNKGTIFSNIHILEFDYEISYSPETDEWAAFYSSGSLLIYPDSLEAPYFQIELKSGLLPNSNYCTCEPEDEGYDEEHKCTGINCECAVPYFTIKKIEIKRNVSFGQLPRFKWQLEKEWIQEEVHSI